MLFKIKLKEHCKEHHAKCWNTLHNLGPNFTPNLQSGEVHDSCQKSEAVCILQIGVDRFYRKLHGVW